MYCHRINVDRLEARAFNCTANRTEALARLPLRDGRLPTVEYPNIESLVVSGAERLPISGNVNQWTKAKSRALLQAYGEDVSEGESDTEQETSERARGRRLKVAKFLGVSTAQLNSCMQVFY